MFEKNLWHYDSILMVQNCQYDPTIFIWNFSARSPVITAQKFTLFWQKLTFSHCCLLWGIILKICKQNIIFLYDKQAWFLPENWKQGFKNQYADSQTTRELLKHVHTTELSWGELFLYVNRELASILLFSVFSICV